MARDKTGRGNDKSRQWPQANNKGTTRVKEGKGNEREKARDNAEQRGGKGQNETTLNQFR